MRGVREFEGVLVCGVWPLVARVNWIECGTADHWRDRGEVGRVDVTRLGRGWGRHPCRARVGHSGIVEGNGIAKLFIIGGALIASLGEARA